MATPLDLQEQEQIDALRSFWKQYGNLITWTLVLVLAAFAAWNGWNWYQRDQAQKAGAMFDELERAAQAGDADRSSRVFGDLKERFARTAYAQQGGLLAAKVLAEKGRSADAITSLQWVAGNALEQELRTIARMRLAGLMADAGQHEAALKELDAATAEGFEALVADRRGDVLLSMGRKDDAAKAYRLAWDKMPSTVQYRGLIETKLTALGAVPPSLAASGVTR